MANKAGIEITIVSLLNMGFLPQEPFFVDGTLRENMIWDSGGDISDEVIKL